MDLCLPTTTPVILQTVRANIHFLIILNLLASALRLRPRDHVERVRSSDMIPNQNDQGASAKTNMSTGRRLIPVTESLLQAVIIEIIYKK